MTENADGQVDEGHGSIIVRTLRRLVNVRRGEVTAMMWSAAYLFFLLGGYYMLRPVRETFGIQRGTDILAALFTGTWFVMLLVNPIFAWVTSRMPRRRFIPMTYHFFSLNILLFYGALMLLPGELKEYAGYVFYVWLSVFNMFAVSVFWAFMADVFSSEQGKRLFPFIGVGGTLGAMGGAAAAAALVTQIKTPHLLVFAVMMIQMAVFCVWRLIKISGGRMQASDSNSSPVHINQREPSRDWKAGFVLLLQSPYLLGIGAYIALMTVLATFVYFEQAQWISEIFDSDEERTAAFAVLDLVANALTLIFQLFLTARLTRAVGVGKMLAILPVITAGGFIALTLAPMFATFAVFQVGRRATQYAIARPVREVLFTVVGPDEKYKSKAFIDTFIYRGGDVVGAWAHRGLAMIGLGLAPVAAVLGAAWVAIALALGVAHRRKASPGEAATREQDSGFAPDD